MTATTVLPEELERAVAECEVELIQQYLPTNFLEGFLVHQMALAMAKLNSCEAIMFADMKRVLERVVLGWDEDRRVQIEDQGARLTKDCSRVSRGLQQSTQGADYLIERWTGLVHVARKTGAWNEAQRKLAFDMLGVVEEVRGSDYKIPVEDDADRLSAVAEREIARLRDLQERFLDHVDLSERSMGAAGMMMSEDATTKRFRRYEASSRRTLNWAIAELRRMREGKTVETQTQDQPAASGPPSSDAWPDDLVRRARLMNFDPAEVAQAEAEAKARMAEVEAERAAYNAATEREPEPEPERCPAGVTVVDILAMGPPDERQPGSPKNEPSPLPAMGPPIYRKTGSSKGPSTPEPRNRHERRAAKSKDRKASR